MSRLRWSNKAVQDLTAISKYLEEKGGLATANRVCCLIYRQVKLLQQFPGSGRPGRQAGTREMVVTEVPAYTIVYTASFSGIVSIVRIWHGAQSRSAVQ